VLWGVNNGFLPDHDRIEHWRGGPRPEGRPLAALGRGLVPSAWVVVLTL
jgi:hypothetical protein